MQTYIILGLVQGIAEWLPVSSQGMVVLVSQFYQIGNFSDLVELALWLHLGTFFAALVYFWKEVVRLLRALLFWKQSDPQTQSLLIFYIIATLISGGIGFLLLQGLTSVMNVMADQQAWILGLIGISLLFTGILQLQKRVDGVRNEGSVTILDALIIGVFQGFAIVPGLSRSGLTIAGLLLRKFDEASSLRLSFIMSLPLVLGANIVLHAEDFAITQEMLVGGLASFVFGLLTIHGLMIVAKKVNFGWFVILFGVLTIMSAFIV